MDEDFDILPREALIRRLHETESRLAESRQENTRIRKTNEFLSAIFFKSPTACAKLTPEGSIEAINDKVSEILGLKPEEILHTNLLEQLPEPRAQTFRRLVRNLTPARNLFYFYLHHTLPDKVMRAYL